MRVAKISRVINPQTISRKMNRASTLPAAVEALSGHNGKLSNISGLNFRLHRSCRAGNPALRGLVQPEQNDQQAAQQQNGGTGSQPQNVGDDRAVFSGGGIVVIAIEIG